MHQNCHDKTLIDTQRKNKLTAFPYYPTHYKKVTLHFTLSPSVHVHWAGHRTALVGTTSIHLLKRTVRIEHRHKVPIEGTEQALTGGQNRH